VGVDAARGCVGDPLADRVEEALVISFVVAGPCGGLAGDRGFWLWVRGKCTEPNTTRQRDPAPTRSDTIPPGGLRVSGL